MTEPKQYYVSIKKIRENNLYKFVILVYVFLLFIAPAISQETDIVKINILTKHLRLSRESGLESIKLDFPNGTALIENNGKNSYINGAVQIKNRDGRWFIEIKDKIYYPPFNLKFINSENSFFNADINNSRRKYSLPLSISGKDEPVLIVTETIDSYCVNSSAAEFGLCSNKNIEAVASQALIIKSGYKSSKKRHTGYDFCDLTHCQVYEGFKNCKIDLSNLEINFKKLKGDLFFHSNCGGRTFDQRIFGGNNAGYTGISDKLYRQGIVLCDKENSWERTINYEDLNEAFFNERHLFLNDFDLIYDKKNMKVILKSSAGEKKFAPESFRLLMNRKYGWNFIKSNNFDITAKDKKTWIFKGKGLGHGVGLCQNGASSMSARGFSRYEILFHYFPEIEFSHVTSEADTPNLSYLLFNIKSGQILNSTNPGIDKRFITAGSVFKLITVLYLASERPDLFSGYEFTCTGNQSQNSSMPERCWKRAGHGKINLENALSGSCNLYFASLYNHIDREKYKKFLTLLKKNYSFKFEFPSIDSDKKFAEILSGLDSGISFYISDLIRLIQIYSSISCDDPSIEEFKYSLPASSRQIISKALLGTFITGTASGEIKKFGPEINYISLLKIKNIDTEGLSGKTSTMLDGTGIPQSYGLFIGFSGETGIITILRNGNGHLSAKWAAKIISDMKK